MNSPSRFTRFSAALALVASLFSASCSDTKPPAAAAQSSAAEAKAKSAAQEIALSAQTPAPPPTPEVTVNWDEVRKSPAVIDVFNMKPGPLLEGEGKGTWGRVPEQLTHPGTQIFTPTGEVNGVADYKVIKAGWLLVACNYDYQGNASGDWQASRWTKQQFRDNGWAEIPAKVLGGVLVDEKNRAQVVFIKQVKAGETGRLRCNKYDPPFFITCGDEADEKDTAPVKDAAPTSAKGNVTAK